METRSETMNYLQQELYDLFEHNSNILDFLDHGSLDGLWYWNLESPEDEWMSPGFWKLLGYDPKEKKHLTKEWQDLIHPDDLNVAIKNLKKHCEDCNYPYDQIVRYTHRAGGTVWVRCRGIAIRDDSGKAIRMLGAHNDITEYKNTELKLKALTKELENLAALDSLTSLLNRRAFYDQLKFILSISKRLNIPSSLIMIDIDYFKTINDTHGHIQGDTILKCISEIITDTIRKSDLACRYGGDEFILAILNSDEENSLILAERIREKIENAIKDTTVSIGVTTLKPKALFGEIDNEICDSLINQSDRALYTAKESGKNLVRHFNSLST